MRAYPDASQTSRADSLPSGKRPKVVNCFIKYGHKYKRNYELEATTFGTNVTQWWDEIKSTGSAMNLRVGGPTGIHIIVVLMCWWCTLLRDRPETELTDFILVLEDIDRAILAAIQGPGNQPPTASPPDGSRSGTRPQARGVKRTTQEEPSTSTRKRLRSGRD